MFDELSDFVMRAIRNIYGTHSCTLCSEKKHPLTFSFIYPCVTRRFKQKLHWIYPRNGRFWQCRN